MSTKIEQEEETAIQIVGNLYKIRRDKIDFSNKLDKDDFCNPRNFHPNSENVAGMDANAIAKLSKSIKERGLTNPLVVHREVTEDGEERFRSLGGSRRLHAIDYLINNDKEVFDVESENILKAKHAFEYIQCRIEPESNTEAKYKAAWEDNDTNENIGNGATAYFVKHLRNIGFDDNTILRITSCSSQWLRETDKLITLDDITFAALAEDKINRKVALDLAQIADVDDRIERLNLALDFANQRKQIEKDEAVAALEKAEDDLEVAEAEEVGYRLLGDAEHEAAAAKKVEKIDKKVKTKKKAVDAANTPAKAKSTDLTKANAKKNNDSSNGMLGKVKIRKQVDVLEKIVKSEDISSEYDNMTLEELRCALAVLSAVLTGEVDITKTFARFSAAKERRMEEVSINDEMDSMDADDDDEQEESDDE